MRFKGLDLNLLLTLQVLLDEHSVSAAAERLNVTQPAISSALKRLREYFNDELLIANGKQLVPSSHALQIAPQLNALLRDVDLFVSRNRHFSPTTLTRRFTLAANDYFCSVILAPLMTRLLAAAPQVELTIVPMDTSIPARINRAEVDLAFSPEDTIGEALASECLFQEGLAVLGCQSNTVFDGGLSVEDIRGAAHALVDLTGVSHKSLVRKKLRAMGINVNNQVTLPSFLIAPELIQNTPLITLVHRRLAKKLCQNLPLQLAELPAPMQALSEFDYCCYYHKARFSDPGLQWLLAQIRQQVAR